MKRLYKYLIKYKWRKFIGKSYLADAWYPAEKPYSMNEIIMTLKRIEKKLDK